VITAKRGGEDARPQPRVAINTTLVLEMAPSTQGSRVQQSWAVCHNPFGFARPNPEYRPPLRRL